MNLTVENGLFLSKDELNSTISISPSTFHFTILEWGKEKTILTLTKDKFIYHGVEINDVNKVYEKFCEWMNAVKK